MLLEAWRRVGSDNAHAELWIVGRARMAVDRLASASPPGVRWLTRFVSDSELAACFRRADVVVLPYLRTECLDFSGVLATALAFGKAAVVSDIGGFGEVAQVDAAWLVPPGEAIALAEALSALLSDPQRCERLAAGARAAAQGPYSWDAAAQATLALYQELIA